MDLKTDKTKVIIFSYAQSLLEAKKKSGICHLFYFA